MAALSFSTISTTANYAIPKLPSSNLQGRSRDTKYHVLIRSAGASNFNFNGRKKFNTRTHQKVKSMSVEDFSNVLTKAEKENRENKSFGSMCIDDNITRINMLFLEVKRRYSSLSAYDTVHGAYPINLILGLSMVNHLESLGIARYFKLEIKEVLDDVYRFWIENEMVEGMPSASDIMTNSISFRILRWNGYDVSPDVFFSYLRDSDFLPFLENSGQATIALLNLYKASQMMFPGERILEEAKSFSQNYLENIKMGDQSGALKDVEAEVKHALDVPWIAGLERIEHLRYMKAFAFDDIWIGETSSRIPFTGKDLILSLAKQDFNICQAAQQEDLKKLEKWSVDSKLGDLQFARQKLVACYFSAASTLFSPEMSTTRIVWTKNAVLTTLMDDFYDVEGSIEDIRSFVEAVKRWDPIVLCNCSANVKKLFSSIYNTVNDIAQDIWIFQGWDITTQLREIWYELAISMMKEAEWTKTGCIPSLEEYMENGRTSIALEPIIFTSLFFIGPKLSEQMIHHHEYKRLMQLLNTCGRLLNDSQSYKREMKQGKLNSLSLFVKEYPATSIEDATEWIRLTVSESTQNILRKLLQPSEIPRECKQIFWNMVKIIQLFYLHSDEFTSPTAMVEHMQAVLFNPVL